MKNRDIGRPIFGLFALQPPTALWCYFTDVPYWSNHHSDIVSHPRLCLV